MEHGTRHRPARHRRWSLPVAAAVAAAVAGVTALGIARKLDGTGHPHRPALRLTANGVVGALTQASALLPRHWWPLTALGCTASCRVRRAVAVAALADIALEHRRDPLVPRAGPLPRRPAPRRPRPWGRRTVLRPEGPIHRGPRTADLIESLSNPERFSRSLPEFSAAVGQGFAMWHRWLSGRESANVLKE
ncbi:hypothetical protein OG747_03580 [Streptomyces sp. NBC_01384]|uniref:hypothetical protein n=1 Tax=Streptomyces sp. NBC_01384 TaxID=2903847 RepID=UPI00324F1C3C